MSGVRMGRMQGPPLPPRTHIDPLKNTHIITPAQVGVLGDVLTNAGNIVAKGRLGPGQMVCADLEAGSFAETGAISKQVSN